MPDQFGLAAVDRWLIAPRLEHWQRHRNVRLLKAEVAACAITLTDIRLVQMEIDVMARYTGVPGRQLLSPALFA